MTFTTEELKNKIDTAIYRVGATADFEITEKMLDTFRKSLFEIFEITT